MVHSNSPLKLDKFVAVSTVTISHLILFSRRHLLSVKESAIERVRTVSVKYLLPCGGFNFITFYIMHVSRI